MEQCQGNMEKYIKDRGSYLNIYEVIILLCQLNRAFHLLDVNNIIHRDVKPSNI
jgi:serine/threonine protein kinase